MKTVKGFEYRAKKKIVDNLDELVQSRYIDISDEEYNRINNGIDTYNNSIHEIYDHLHDITFTEQQKSELIQKIETLESEVQTLKQVAYDSISYNNGILDLSNIM